MRNEPPLSPTGDLAPEQAQIVRSLLPAENQPFFDNFARGGVLSARTLLSRRREMLEGLG